jgi:hypothetical protein
MPVTTPAVLTVPTPGVLLLQVPPDVALLSVVVPLTQVFMVPVITDGGGVTFSVTVVGTAQPQIVVDKLYTYVPVAVGDMVAAEHVEHVIAVGPVHE